MLRCLLKRFVVFKGVNVKEEFDSLFDASELPNIITKNKTVSKEECRGIFQYMEKYRPQKILEFGTGAGISCKAFLTFGKWLGLGLNFHSWDKRKSKLLMQYADRKEFVFHEQDVTGQEAEILDKHSPDLIFFDVHPYKLLNNMVSLCLKRKINFMFRK